MPVSEALTLIKNHKSMGEDCMMAEILKVVLKEAILTLLKNV